MKKILTGSIFCLFILVVFAGLTIAADYDFEGRTVQLQGWNMGGSFEEGEGRDLLLSVEDSFNVNIEFVNLGYHDIGDEIREGVIAGDADGIYHLPEEGVAQQLALEGFLYPLDAFAPPVNYWEARVFGTDPLKIAGSQFFFDPANKTTLAAIYDDIAFWSVPFDGVYYNKTMLEEFGLPDLNDLFEQGEWTWDAFKEIAEGLTRDTTGDGDIDQWGYTGSWGLFNSPVDWLISNGVQVVEEKDGRYLYNLDNQDSIDTFAFLRSVYEAEVINEDYWGWAQHPWVEEVSGIYFGHLWTFSNVFEDITFEAGFVPFPKGPNAERNVSPLGRIPVNVIPITTEEDPEALMALHAALFMSTDEHYSFDDMDEMVRMRFGEFAHSQEMLDNLMYANSNVVVAQFHSTQYLDFHIKWDMMQPIVLGEESAASLIDSFKTPAQTRIDLLFDQ